ncbi:FkbM family methyltransferase, partial [Alphaproteobacteria bacterium]|nr:FkbM family methyltransferase [Alphaproteobacteria bacterium]
MINKIIKSTLVIFQPKLFTRLISMYAIGYLNEIGWINSFKKQMPIDKNSNPLPWVTYGFIDFIFERLNKNIDVFEYGSGNSTLWYAMLVNSVTSVEHDRKWLEKIKNSMPENADMHYQELEYGGTYSQYPNQLNKKFNIVIV